MNPKTKLRKQCDRAYFKKLLKPECEVCGKPSIQVHHFYYKGSYGHLRYDLSNGISLCQGCHFVLHARDPKKIEEQIIKVRGIEWYETLKKKSRENPQSYQKISYYKEILKQL